MPKQLKGPVGRPKSFRPIREIVIKARFDEEYDADLLKIIDAAPEGKRWATMKMMMRSGVVNMPNNVEVEEDSFDNLLDF